MVWSGVRPGSWATSWSVPNASSTTAAALPLHTFLVLTEVRWFLRQIYRELEKRDVKSKVTSFSNVPGGKPKTASSSKHDHALADDDEPDMKPYSLQGSIASGLVTPSLDISLDMSPEERRARKIRERQLVGSLTASFRFKEKGLIKKVRPGTLHSLHTFG